MPVMSSYVLLLLLLSLFSGVRLCVTLWTAAHQAPLSTGFSRQGYWGGWPCPPPRGLPNSGTEPVPLKSLALAVGFFTNTAIWEIPNLTPSSQGYGISSGHVWM